MSIYFFPLVNIFVQLAHIHKTFPRVTHLGSEKLDLNFVHNERFSKMKNGKQLYSLELILILEISAMKNIKSKKSQNCQ